MFLWFSKIMWETKTNNLFHQCLWQPNLTKWWLILSPSYLLRHVVLQDHMTNLKEYISTTINAYDHQTW